MIVWADGALCEETDVQIGPFDRGLTLGDGLFETMLWTGSRLARAADHAARLAEGAAFLAIPLTLDAQAIAFAAATLAHAHDGHGSTKIVRLTLTRGIGPRGLAFPAAPEPRLLMTLSNAPAKPEPSHLRVVSIQRNPTAPSARFKTLSYVDNVGALAEAQRAGGTDALMLSSNGQVACCSAANLFAFIDGVWVTPPVADGALPGVVRKAALLRGAVARTLSYRDLCNAEALATTNAIVGVRPVSSLDGVSKPINHLALEELEHLITDTRLT